jgi:hypothetical protein
MQLALHYVRDGRCSCGGRLKDCRPGKHSLGTWTPRTAEELSSRLAAFNVGILTGQRSRVWVLDTDGADGEKWAFWTWRLWQMRTPTVISRQGKHRYFRQPGGVMVKTSAKELHPQVDVRGDGGLTVAPPSVHKSGHVYYWAPGLAPWEVPFALAPEGLLELVKRAPKVTTGPILDADAMPQLIPEIVPFIRQEIKDRLDLLRATESGRNTRITSVAYTVGGWAAWLSEDDRQDVLADLQEAADETGYDADKRVAIVNRQFSQGLRNPIPVRKERGYICPTWLRSTP